MVADVSWKGPRCVAGVPIEQLASEPAEIRYNGLNSHEIKELRAYELSASQNPTGCKALSYDPLREINIPIG